MKMKVANIFFIVFLLIGNFSQAQSDNPMDICKKEGFIAYITHNSYADSVIGELLDFIQVDWPDHFVYIATKDELYGENSDEKLFCIYMTDYMLNLDSMNQKEIIGNPDGQLYMAQLSNRKFVINQKHIIPVIFESDSHFGTNCGIGTGMWVGVGCFARFYLSIKAPEIAFYKGIRTSWEFEYQNGEKILKMLHHSKGHFEPNPREEYHKLQQLEDSLNNDSLQKPE